MSRRGTSTYRSRLISWWFQHGSDGRSVGRLRRLQYTQIPILPDILIYTPFCISPLSLNLSRSFLFTIVFEENKFSCYGIPAYFESFSFIWVYVWESEIKASDHCVNANKVSSVFFSQIVLHGREWRLSRPKCMQRGHATRHLSGLLEGSWTIVQ